MLLTRPFAEGTARIFQGFPSEIEGKKQLIVAVSSDRGLCGAINSGVAKMTRALAKEKESKGAIVQIASIGEKGTAQFARDSSSKIIFSTGETGKKPQSFAAVSVLADKILQSDFDAASIVYSQFISLIAYKQTTHEFPGLASLMKNRQLFDQYEFEDDNQEFHLRDLLEFHMGTALYSAIYESSASELAARMSSMDNATRNAGDLIKRLSVAYNRRRQAAITTELSEIISGAAAVST